MEIFCKLAMDSCYVISEIAIANQISQLHVCLHDFKAQYFSTVAMHNFNIRSSNDALLSVVHRRNGWTKGGEK